MTPITIVTCYVRGTHEMMSACLASIQRHTKCKANILIAAGEGHLDQGLFEAVGCFKDKPLPIDVVEVPSRYLREGREHGCILDRVMKFASKVWSIVLTTIASSVVTAMVTGSSYLSMIIPGELLAPIYQKKNLAAKNLSRIIEESGAIIVPLIPWSMAGVYITGTIGVSTFSYLPWAVMNYVAVVILAVFGFTGFSMAERVREDETIIGS